MCDVVLAVALAAAAPAARANAPLEIAARVRMTDRTVFLCEIPLVTTYSNGNLWTGYAGRWTDGPLLIDRKLDYIPGQYYRVTAPDLWRTLEEMRLNGIDAATFNVHTKGLDIVVSDCCRKGRTPAGLVPDYPPIERIDKLRGRKEDEPYFGPAFTNANNLVVAGKPLVTTYYSFRTDGPGTTAKLDYLKAKYGDFWFVPQGMTSGLRRDKWKALLAAGREPDAATVEKLKENVRAQLRRYDGIIWSDYNAWERVYDGEASVDIEAIRTAPLRILGEVYREPEFDGKKFFGMMVGMGHANSYTFGNRNSSDGTRTLREMLALAFETKPDIVLFFEWNEWNENTGVCPSLWNSFAPRRIVRAMRAAYERRPNEPLEGDDLTVPNLVLSLRKTLSLGEVAQYELLTVPDAAAAGTVTAELSLVDENGTSLKRFPSVTLDATKMDVRRFRCDSAAFGNACAAVPRLKVTYGGRTRAYDTGLPFTEMRVSGNWDHKWALQPLRDLLGETDLRIRHLGGTDRDGKTSVEMKLDAREEIDRLELLDGGDIVYSHTGNPAEEWREDRDHYVFSILNSVNNFAQNAYLEVSGVSGAEWMIATNRTTGLRRNLLCQSVMTPDTYLKVRKDEAQKAKVKLSWPGNGVYEIALGKVLDSGFFGVSGTNGLSFVVNRFLRQAAFFASVGTNRVTCAAELIPDLPVSVVSAHAITEKGKIFRSQPLVVGTRSGEKTPRVCWSELEQRVVRVDVSKERVPELAYEFSGDFTGTEVRSGFGRPFNGSLGGFTAAATLRNRGGDTRQHCCLQDERRNGFPPCAPRQLKTDGIPTLVFDGSGTYFVLPGGTLPRYGAYSLSFEFRTDDLGRQQELFSCGYGIPVHWGMIGYLRIREDGRIAAIGLSEHPRDDAKLLSSNVIDPKGWNRLEIVSHVDSLELVLNGVSAGKVKVLPPGRHDANCWFGGRKGSLFKGQLRNVRVSHAPGFDH